MLLLYFFVSYYTRASLFSINFFDQCFHLGFIVRFGKDREKH